MALAQRPIGERRRLPGCHRLGSGQLGELLLPLLQGGGVGVVHLYRAEGAGGATLAQPGLKPASEATEMRVLAIAQREHRVVQVVQRPRLAQHLALEGAGTVRGFAVAEGAHHEQGATGLLQVAFTQLGQWTDLHRQAGRLQLAGTLPGQLFGETALAGETDQPAVGARLGTGY